jgi:hypothetical protein
MEDESDIDWIGSHVGDREFSDCHEHIYRPVDVWN